MSQSNSTLALPNTKQPAATAPATITMGNRWPVLSLCNWRQLLASASPSLCNHCDGFGQAYNNADTTSNQFQQCAVCGDERGQP